MFFDDPIYGGAMRAANLIETFRGMGRNQEMFERNKMRQQALDSAAETEQTLKLMQLARPADAAGRVQYGMNTPAQVRGVPGFMPQISVNRDVDPSRRLDVTGFDGRSRGVFEAMTADELMGRASQQQQAGLMQKLAADAQLEQIRQGTRLQREKGLATFKDEQEAKRRASEPTVDPNNLMGLQPIPFSAAGGVASLVNAVRPRTSQVTNHETGDVIRTGTDLSGKPLTVTSPEWKGAAKPRPRVGQAARGGSGNSAKREEQFRQAEEMKQLALREAEEQFLKDNNKDTLKEAKDKAQLEYKKAIVKAGGSVSPRQASGGRGGAPQQQAPIFAINPQTGQRITLKDGKWVPAQ
jgi:hypothetical protein